MGFNQSWSTLGYSGLLFLATYLSNQSEVLTVPFDNCMLSTDIPVGLSVSHSNFHTMVRHYLKQATYLQGNPGLIKKLMAQYQSSCVAVTSHMATKYQRFQRYIPCGGTPQPPQPYPWDPNSPKSAISKVGIMYILGSLGLRLQCSAAIWLGLMAFLGQSKAVGLLVFRCQLIGAPRLHKRKDPPPKGSIYCPFKDSGSKHHTWYSFWNQSP